LLAFLREFVRNDRPKMKFQIVLAAAAVLCLTSCASYEITQAKINQVRKGVTTESDLIQLFGPPDTEWSAFHGNTSIDWFRSEGPSVAGYLPVVGQFTGGLDLNVQQLSIVIGVDGRVASVMIYDSNGAVGVARPQFSGLDEKAYPK
jgi:hypothetical protein